MAHPLLELAREVLGAHFRGEDWRHRLEGPGPPARGCFVSLKHLGQLRGCIGTIAPVRRSLTLEVAENTLAAATRDPRFPPLLAHELPRLTISIDLLSKPEPVHSLDDLAPDRFGLLVQQGKRQGVLLPDLPGVRTVADQLRICREKAGIPPEQPVEMSRFEVERFSE